MTHEESQKLKQEHAAGEKKYREPARQLEAEFYARQRQEMLVYHFADAPCAMNDGNLNYRFRVSVNPVSDLVEADFLHHSPSNVSYKAYLALSEIVEMFEGWRVGTIKHMPPSGDWFDAKVWLVRQQIGDAE